MKKLLLILGSWAMMLIGTATFTSCGDDEGNNNDGNNGDTSSQITLVEKYKDIKEATIDGDDVLYPDPIFQGMIAVYHRLRHFRRVPPQGLHPSQYPSL